MHAAVDLLPVDGLYVPAAQVMQAVEDVHRFDGL